MTDRPAITAPPFLDGYLLSAPAESWKVRPLEARALTRTQGLGLVETTVAPVGRRPERTMVHTFALRYANAGKSLPRIRELLATTGAHRLILWRTHRLAWRGDGSSDLVELPRGWRLAQHAALETAAPPSGANTTLALRIGYDGTPLDVQTVDQATWDAGPPPAGVAHILHGGNTFRLPSVPSVDDVVYGAVVPEYRVVEASRDDEVELTQPVGEPLELVLEEM
ncbi:MAG: hypothetical protein AAGC60_00305 [Acidobacteriota bacterium]